MSLNKIAFLLLLGAAPLLATVARADEEEDIDYRQHIMKTMDEQMAAIQQIIQHKVPADNFATHLQVVAVAAATAKAAFTPASAGGRAKPEVWSKWADFSKRLDELAAASAALAKSANEADVAATAAKLDTLKCQGCHDTYRQKKK
jgi:cytochrome c556